MPNVTVYVISKQWADLPSKTTPIFAADMTHIEQGIKNVTDFVNTLNAEAGLYLCAAPFTSELADKLDGIEANANNYTLPTASTSTKGGVKVDDVTITIDANGVISAVGGGGGSSTISGLTDVQLNQLADGEVLKWDVESSKWVNAEENGGTTVVANPSGTATDDLTKIQIGNTVYDVEGGSGEVVEMTYAQYQALTPQQKMDGTVRYVTDYPSGGGGSGAGYTKELVYDSGSWSTYAPWNEDVPFIKSIAEYDQLLFLVASPADNPATGKTARSALIVDIDCLSEVCYFNFYMSRTLRIANVTNTTFNYYSTVHDQYDRGYQIGIYKIYGIKFGGCSSYNFSTTEQRTGQKWIDGKDIYCAVISNQHVQHAANAYWEYDLTSLDIDEPLWYFARCGKNSNTPQIVFPWVTDYHDNNQGVKFESTKFGIRGKSSGDYTNVNIILWYTKN